MNKSLIITWGAVALWFTAPMAAQVPSTLNYQGRIAVSGVNFTGTGQFKFALVNSAGNQTYWSNDGSSAAGSQPTAAVSIPVNSGLYSVLLGDTSLTNMTAVPATVFANADVKLRVWFSDGTNGFQLMTPDQKIASVGYAMVAATVPDGSITAAKLAPGVGGGGGSVADGSITAAKLAPGAAASNLNAGNLSAIAAGGVIGSTDANNAALLAQGFVRDPAVLQSDGTWLPLPSGDTVAAHTAVWTGTELLIWGGVEPAAVAGMSSYAAINRGIRYNPTTGAWTPISTVGAPQARFGHSAVWTGTEMLIWGGQSSDSSGNPATVLATGGKYNPTTNTWASMSPNVTPGPMPEMPGTPDPRRGHLAFWTGTEMLIWGGRTGTQALGSTTSGTGVILPGRRYNLASNTWSSMAATLPELPAGDVTDCAGVWTGAELIIWRGAPGPILTLEGISIPYGGRYSPDADAWQTLPPLPNGLGSLQATTGFSAVWTGTEMILWGGLIGLATTTNDGLRLNPTTSTWSDVSTIGTPVDRSGHFAVWSGSEMIVWGGQDDYTFPTTPTKFNDGGRYNPTTNTWQSMSSTNAPPSRSEATVTAAGDKLIVWAGAQMSSGAATTPKFLKHGGIYQPGTDAWTPLYNGSPAPRYGHTAIWTGTDLIVWGGTIASAMPPAGMDPTFTDGARFNAATGVWTPLPSQNAPSGRFGHTAVWTGTEMIVWGGQRFETTAGMTTTVTLSTGARYNPLTNTWTATTDASSPSARSKHTAVWAGAPVNQMIVWGGTSDGMAMNVNSGGRYNPAADTWSATTTTSAPMAASGHTSLWTGSEMIVFGGNLMAGSRYYPISNAWLAMASAPIGLNGGATSGPVSLWTGNDMLSFVPGPSASTSILGSYSPISDLWQTLSGTGAPSGDGASLRGIWTGSEMIVWGVTGVAMGTATTSGGRYSPATGSWTSLESVGAPSRAYGSSVWTGSEMLLWGGTISSIGMGFSTASDKGHRYRLPQSYYFYRRP